MDRLVRKPRLITTKLDHLLRLSAARNAIPCQRIRSSSRYRGSAAHVGVFPYWRDQHRAGSESRKTLSLNACAYLYGILYQKKHQQLLQQRAQEIVQTTLPSFIEHLQRLLVAAENEETSPFWKGHLESEDFTSSVRFPDMLCCHDQRRALNIPGRVAKDQQGLADDLERSHEDSGNEFDHDRDHPIPGVCWLGELSPNAFCDRVLDIARV